METKELSLHEAVCSLSVDLEHVTSLVRSNPLSLNVPNEEGLYPILVAAHRGHSELIRVLAEHGADLHVQNSKKQTPFLVACQVWLIVCERDEFCPYNHHS